MINSKLTDYQNKLDGLKELNIPRRAITPDVESSFNVYLNTRKIEVPKEFKQIAIQGEHNAETIWFSVDRFFDGEDLAKKSWSVQFINAIGEELKLPMSYTSIATSYKDGAVPGAGDNGDRTLKLGWDIPYELTKAPGNVILSLHCQGTRVEHEGKGQVSEYHLFTEPITLTVGKGLYITSDSNLPGPIKDSLSDMVAKISQLYDDKQVKYPSFDEIEDLPKIGNNYTLRGGENNITDIKNALDLQYSDLDPNSIPQLNYSDLVEGTLPTITIEGKTKVIGKDEIAISYPKITIDTEIKDSENPVQNKVIKKALSDLSASVQEEIKPSLEEQAKDITANADAIKKLQQELEELNFVPIAISSFSANPTLFEIGSSTENQLKFNWELNRNPITIDINGDSISNFDMSVADYEWKSITDPGADENHTVNFTLNVVNKTSASKSISIIFTHKVYYGEAAQADYNADFIKSLKSRLQTSRAGEFTATAAEEQYIYYAVPTEYGTPIFNVGGFEGGFGLVASNIQVQNAYGVTIAYDLYQSTNSNLGSTNIKIS